MVRRNHTTRNAWAGLNTALVVTFLLFAQACGNDDGVAADAGDLAGAPGEEADGISADDSVDPSDPGGAQSLGPGTASGVYIVDGESRNAMMARCEEDSAAVVSLLEGPSADHDGQLEIRISTEDGTQQFNISVASFGTGVFRQVATTDPDGNWYTGYYPRTDSIAIAGPPYSFEGDQLTGELTLDLDESTNPDGESETIDVSFDLIVPSEPSGLC